METTDLKNKYPDLKIIRLTMNVVYSNRDIIEKIKEVFGNTIVQYEHSGKKVTVASSVEFGLTRKPGDQTYFFYER